MKQRLESATNKLTSAAKARPAEVKWSIIGAAAGAFIGLLIGGVGVAAMGSAAGVPASLILALIGAVIGNRFGISRDRPIRQMTKSRDG